MAVHVGRAPRTAQQSHLAEEITGAQADVPAGNGDLHRSDRNEIGGVRADPLADRGGRPASRCEGRTSSRRSSRACAVQGEAKMGKPLDQLRELQPALGIALGLPLARLLQPALQGRRDAPCHTHVAPPVARSFGTQCVDCGEDEGFRMIDSSAPASIRSRASAVSRPVAMPSPARMNENSPICASDGGNGERRRHWIAQPEHDQEGGERLAEDDDGEDGRHRQRLVDQDRRVEQHPDGDEEQHRERILHRQEVGSGTVAEVGLTQNDAGEECSERERNAEYCGRAVGDAERHGEDGEREQFARAGAC